MILLGIDYGTRRVGIAWVNTGSVRVAAALTILPNDQNLFREIVELIKLKAATRVIVGYPRSLSGSTTEQTAITEDFIAKLKKETDVDIQTEDETLSTAVVSEVGSEPGTKTVDEYIDHKAAALILQDYIDSHKI